MESFDLGDLIGSLAGVTGASVQLICAAICAAIYAAKGKPWVGGAFMGFFLGPFGVFVAIVSGGWDHRHKLRPAYVPQTVPASPPRPSNTYALPLQTTHCSAEIDQVVQLVV